MLEVYYHKDSSMLGVYYDCLGTEELDLPLQPGQTARAQRGRHVLALAQGSQAGSEEALPA